MSSQLIDTINRHLHATQWPSDITTSPATKEQYENILVSALIIKGANLKKQNKVDETIQVYLEGLALAEKLKIRRAMDLKNR